MLTELETQNRKEARTNFVKATWRGEEPATLLPLASAAGLTAEEADRLVRRIRQGKEQVDSTNRLPGLRKDAAGAKARFDKIQSHASAEISRLESEMETAAIEADIALKAQQAAERDSRELLVLLDEGLLPPEETPREVLYLAERREAEQKCWQADSARTAARDERDRRLADVRDAEERLASFPVTLNYDRAKSEMKDRLKAAKKRLADAEDRLAKAEAAADAARKAIP